jgi:hypothetical protein
MIIKSILMEAQYEKAHAVGHASADRLLFRFCRKY